MNIEEIISILIPPSDYRNRNGISLKKEIIDDLSIDERKEVEERLLSEIQKGNTDEFILEALIYFKSLKAVPILLSLLNENYHSLLVYIKVAVAVFEINENSEVEQLALKYAAQIKDKYDLIGMFYLIARFKSETARDFILSFVSHSDFLVSYNAKQSLKILE